MTAQSNASAAPLNQSLQQRLSRGSHIPALDAVRGAAAWLVVMGHTFGPAALGRMAVSVFFVLSGFLITWLLVRESESTGKISLRDFYIRRTLRIFPAFYVFWIVCILAAVVRHAHIPWGEAWSSFFYMGDYYSALHASHINQIMGVTWSLGVEEKFYLLWPATFAFLHRNPRTLFRFTLASIAAIWIYRIVMCLAFSLPPDYLRYAFESRFDNILYGCALALGLKLLKIEPLLAAVNRFKLLPFVCGGALIAMAVFEDNFSLRFTYVLGMALMSMLVAVMLIQLVFLGAIRQWRWLDHPLLRFFGRISYSLYLYHIVVIALVDHFFPHLRIRLSYPLIYGGSTAAAYASYVIIEKPFLRLKHRFEVVAPATESRTVAPPFKAQVAGASDVAS